MERCMSISIHSKYGHKQISPCHGMVGPFITIVGAAAIKESILSMKSMPGASLAR